MLRRRFVFFDVGNTLLFPNRPRLLSQVPPDRHPTLETWQAVERRSKLEFDQGLMEGKADRGFWWIFYTHLLRELDGVNEDMRKVLVDNTHLSSNWDQIRPGTREALERIRKKYSTAVISNADGKIDIVLRQCGIFDSFSSITDSGNVGHEKPHPAIFEAALRAMNADPAESLYVGDVYSVDYVGATNAGMKAVLFDVAGAYRDRGFPRVESLAELESWLEK